MSEGITKDSLLTTLPAALDSNKTMHALAVASAKILANRLEEIERVRIYTALENLPEELLDSLAYDFKIDWWDYDYSKEQKLQILKTNWAVHRHMGTKSAVETAIRSIFADTTVEEWFEYGGKPYTFRILIDMNEKDASEEVYDSVMERAWFYKNLRSHLGGIVYTMEAETLELHCGSAVCAEYSRVTVEVPYDPTANDIITTVEIYCGAVSCGEHMRFTVNVASNYPIYDGETTIVPKVVDQELQTQNTVVMSDITVKEIPVSDVSNTSGGITITIG